MLSCEEKLLFAREWYRLTLDYKRCEDEKLKEQINKEINILNKLLENPERFVSEH
ncbi:hypothetical protein [Bacillus sp. V3-13]|uniref:hypothetical protein n=1 Tax=Bacillus sp. V3-13 TaxID=2053728 RepID=UPI0015E10CD7|nr:hypothetical protein [Bacillus sp. V3-13]